MRSKQRRSGRNLGYEGLENRKLLAADFGMPIGAFEMMIPGNAEFVEVMEVSPEQMNFEVAMMDGMISGEVLSFDMFLERQEHRFGTSTPMFMDLGAQTEAHPFNFAQEFRMFDSEGSVFMHGVMPSEFGDDVFAFDGWADTGSFAAHAQGGFVEYALNGDDFPFGMDVEFVEEFEGTSEVDSVETGVEAVELEGELIDLSDGADGVFATLDSDNPSQTYSFIATEDGQANVVLSTDLAEGELAIELVDGEGNIVEPNATESGSSFTSSSYGIQSGSVYSLNIAGEEGTTVQFQLTVTVEAAEPVDQHSDEIGEAATQLDFENGFANVQSDFETDGDRDVFQWVADASGEAFIHASDLNTESDLNLSVTVYDANGDELAMGKTNASVSLDLETTEGETYFIALNADEGQAGSYNVIVLNGLDPLGQDGTAVVVDADEANELDGEIVDGEFDDGEFDDGEFVVVDEAELSELGDDVVVVAVEVDEASEVDGGTAVVSKGDQDDFEAEGVVDEADLAEFGDDVVVVAVEVDEAEAVTGSGFSWFEATAPSDSPEWLGGQTESSQLESRQLRENQETVGNPLQVAESQLLEIDGQSDDQFSAFDQQLFDTDLDIESFLVSEMSHSELDGLFSSDWFKDATFSWA